MSGRLVPASPFEVEASKEILQRRIEAGDITQGDVDLLKKGYRWMTTASFIGSSALGVGTYFALKRRRPPVALGFRLLGAGSAGMFGSFIGFTLGGVAAAMEVEKNMTDSQKKMKVFAEIANESRKTIYEHRVHDMQESGRLPNQRQRPLSGDASGSVRPPPGSSPRAGGAAGVDAEPTWDVEGDEKRMEEDRERDFTADLGRIERDASFAGGPATGGPRESMADNRDSKAGRQEILRATRGTWDRIRQDTFGKAQAAGGGGAAGDVDAGAGVGMGMGVGGGRASEGGRRLGQGKEDERTREQREFDEMLERERQGVKSEDKWA